MVKKAWMWVPAGAIVLLTWLCFQIPQHVEASDSKRQKHKEIYINLDRDFYEALQDTGGRGASRTYSNDPRDDYLRRIAVAGEFTVKTNLTIIRQQEQIIELLEALQRRGLQEK